MYKMKLNNIVESCKMVNSLSKHVKINYEKINKMIEQISLSTDSYWMACNPYNILKMKFREVIKFLLIYHSIGDFCLWGSPKWEIDTEDGKLDGTYAILYLINKHIKEFEDYDMTYEHFYNLLMGNVEMPLLMERFNNLKILHDVLKKDGENFLKTIDNIYDDEILFEFINEKLPFFKDESIYDGQTVYFYKRAQLLTSDILHAKKYVQNKEVNYNNLVGCADYKIPQVMRCYGILEFDDYLSKLVDNKLELKSGSQVEVEIRANMIVVIDYVAKKLKNEIARMDINDYFWQLGQDKVKMINPYHRVMTSKY